MRPYVPPAVLDPVDTARQMTKPHPVHGYGMAWDHFHPGTKFQVILSDWMEGVDLYGRPVTSCRCRNPSGAEPRQSMSKRSLVQELVMEITDLVLAAV